MSDTRLTLQQLIISPTADKLKTVSKIQNILEDAGYKIAERDDQRPWGAFLRLENNQAETFIQEFFPGLTLQEAQLGIANADLSPKILLVAPGQRLSWQYHDRRAERWAFLTDGAYFKSETDEQGNPVTAISGDVVQFGKGERHRLVAQADAYTVVAEIWQHSDPVRPSNEDDIVRLADDYKR